MPLVPTLRRDKEIKSYKGELSQTGHLFIIWDREGTERWGETRLWPTPGRRA